jgi:hypothetical protein
LALLLLMAVGAALFYLRSAGVPEFLKARLVAEFRAKGWSLQFDRLRLRGLQLLVDNVRLAREAGPSGGRAGPTILIPEAELALDQAILKLGRLRPERLRLSGARLSWPLSQSNAPQRQVSLDDIAADLSLLPNGVWTLAEFSGRFTGAELHVSGTITNASAMREWRKPAHASTNDWPRRVDELMRKLEQLQLAQPSALDLRVRGDGRDPASFEIALHLHSPKAAWGGNTLQGLDLVGTVLPSQTTPAASTMKFDVRIESALSGWGELREVRLTGQASGSLTNRSSQELDWQLSAGSLLASSMTGQTVVVSGRTRPSGSTLGPWQTELSVTADLVSTPWGDARANHLTASLAHGLPRLGPWEADWQIDAGPVESRWGQAAHAQLSGQLRPSVEWSNWRRVDTSWGLWTKVEPFEASWTCAVRGIDSPKLKMETLSCTGQWRAPEVVVHAFEAGLYGGRFQSSARLDVSTREVSGQARSDFDVHRVQLLLTKTAQRWLSQFGWETAPKTSAEIRLLLPSWTNARPQWREEVMPTIELAGEFAGSNGAFRGVPVAYARSHFTLTNLVWHLPDLLVKRPDGEATLDYTGSMATHTYRWRVDARVDPVALKPLLPEQAAQRVFDQLDFTLPPAVQGEVWGRWHEPETVGFSGRVSATNFTFRNELVSQLSGAVRFTNSMLSFADVLVRHDTQQVSVPSGRFDFTERVVYVTNAISTVDPDLVTRMIGPRVRAALQPYRFRTPPTVRISGRLPTFNTQDADVRFEVAGEGFSYWKFNVPSVTGDVHWRGDDLSITNVQASFYGGELAWQGRFDFSPPVGAQLAFQGTVKNADLHALMADLGKKTNNLQGTLEGQVVIDRAESDDWRSWEGSGWLRLRDGFLWGIPIFGFFSPVLNTVVPGLGNSAVKSGDTTFTIDQSVIRTSDLELKSPALRLRYDGSVDLKAQVHARMQAEILRDAWGVGRVISLVLWPLSKAFEYRITGSVYHPKSQPVYIPRLLLWPLHPFRSIKTLIVPSPAKPDSEFSDPFSLLPEKEADE